MSTRDQIEKEAASANRKLNEASDTIKDTARSAANEAQRTATAYAEQGRQAAASNLNDFASAVRRASDELSGKDQGLAARLVGQAAGSLEDLANSVSGANVDDVMGQVQGFARRNPAAFMVGSVLAGIALGRFAKASGERSHDEELYARPSGGAYASTTQPVGTSGTVGPAGGVGGTSTRTTTAPSNTTLK